MISFAFDGITSFSIKPLRISLVMGLIAFLVAIVIFVYSIIQLILGNTVSGWTSITISVWAVGGMQLLMLGIVGEYIGKIYLESKHRPKFIIQDVLYKEF
jgi:glycosyltransferase involved in cell wall biosynthesis